MRYGKGRGGRTSGLLPLAMFCVSVVVTTTLAWAETRLTDPAGYLWDIDDSGTGTPPADCGSGHIGNGTSDAYDSFGFLCVTASGAAFTTECTASDVYCGTVAPSTEMSGRQVVLGEDTLQGLTVQRRVFVPSSGPTDANSFVRYYDTFRNPTGSPITVQLRFGSASPGYNDLGSDSSTTCEGSSSGDRTPDTADLWITTDDTDGSGDPSLGFVFMGAGATEVIDFVALNPYSSSGEDDELMWGFDSVTVPAGTTVAFMTFMIQDSNQTRAQAESTYLAGAPSEAIDGLTGTQISQIRNFAFCSDCDGDGYTIDMGDCDDYDDTIHPGVTTDYCDGADNDCDPTTPDGSSESWYGTPCDGPDTDLCEDGIEVCIGGARECNDDDLLSPDICDGVDNDCDPTTPDGSGDPLVGAACDGDDPDLCEEGTYSCVSGALSCSDTMDETPELCDTIDNDCDPATDDGIGEDWYLAPCDGPDSDLCEEGTYGCVSGVQVCDDATGDIDDLCNNADDDCNPTTVDGEDEAWNGDPCDGPDTDLCAEGTFSCVDGMQTCNDTTDDNPEVCNGVDDDCNPATSETMDNDGDGISACGGDCDDGDPTIYPGAPEVCGDGIDQDCDPTTDHDSDEDGYHDCEGDCAPMNPDIHPGALEVCNDGHDNDCNGLVDGFDPVCSGSFFNQETGCGCVTVPGEGGAGWIMALLMALLGLGLGRRS